MKNTNQPSGTVKVVKYEDKRGIPVALVILKANRNDEFLLDDEQQEAYAQGMFPSECVPLPEFDMELACFNITHRHGGPMLPPKGSVERAELMKQVCTEIQCDAALGFIRRAVWSASN